MKMQRDQQCDHPGDQLPVQLYILVVYSDNLAGSCTVRALTEEWL